MFLYNYFSFEYNSENLDVSDCYILLNLDEAFKNPKYIKYMCQLQIKQRTFDLTSDNSNFKYDGITHFLVNPRYDETSLLDGDHVEYVGLTLPGVSNGFVILNSDNEDVTNKMKELKVPDEFDPPNIFVTVTPLLVTLLVVLFI